VADRRLRIWHAGALPSERHVNGVNSMVWTLARAQASQGHAVTLLFDQRGVAPNNEGENGLDFRDGITVRRVVGDVVSGSLFADARPDILHLHSVSHAWQALLAARARSGGIPYIVTPNGGLSPRLLTRGRKWLKTWYKWLLQRKQFEKAAFVVAVSPGEESDVLVYAPRSRGRVRYIPNPVPNALFAAEADLTVRSDGPIVFMGRFDVQHKGLDRLWVIADAMPDQRFELYGTANNADREAFGAVAFASLDNVRVHSPVYGNPEKMAILRTARLYLQCSRWEGFTVSVAEAMAAGTPVAIMDGVNMARLLRDERIGFVLPAEPELAVPVLRKLLADVKLSAEMARRARTFARGFEPCEVATAYETLYRRAQVSVARGSLEDTGGAPESGAGEDQ
jgi:glycosyltransferase involved in cell wall biosynthesis